MLSSALSFNSGSTGKVMSRMLLRGDCVKIRPLGRFSRAKALQIVFVNLADELFSATLQRRTVRQVVGQVHQRVNGQIEFVPRLAHLLIGEQVLTCLEMLVAFEQCALGHASAGRSHRPDNVPVSRLARAGCGGLCWVASSPPASAVFDGHAVG